MSQVIEVRNEYRTAEFKDILAQQKASGLSVRAFCIEHGIGQHTYYYRLRKLRQQMCQQPTLQEFQLESPSNATPNIQIQYHGAVIEVADEPALQSVLRAISSL